MAPDTIAILRKVLMVCFFQGHDIQEYRTKLNDNVLRWKELNDALCWSSVVERRAHLLERGERLVDDWQFAFFGRFWDFDVSPDLISTIT